MDSNRRCLFDFQVKAAFISDEGRARLRLGQKLVAAKSFGTARAIERYSEREQDSQQRSHSHPPSQESPLTFSTSFKTRSDRLPTDRVFLCADLGQKC